MTQSQLVFIVKNMNEGALDFTGLLIIIRLKNMLKLKKD